MERGSHITIGEAGTRAMIHENGPDFRWQRGPDLGCIVGEETHVSEDDGGSGDVDGRSDGVGVLKGVEKRVSSK